jgi:hypothetical protein
VGHRSPHADRAVLPRGRRRERGGLRRGGQAHQRPGDYFGPGLQPEHQHLDDQGAAAVGPGLWEWCRGHQWRALRRRWGRWEGRDQDPLRLHARDQHLDHQGAHAERRRVRRQRCHRREAVRVHRVSQRVVAPAVRPGHQHLDVVACDHLPPQLPRRRRDRREVLSGGRKQLRAYGGPGSLRPGHQQLDQAASDAERALRRRGHGDRRPTVRRGRGTVDLYGDRGRGGLQPRDHELAGTGLAAFPPRRCGGRGR